MAVTTMVCSPMRLTCHNWSTSRKRWHLHKDLLTFPLCSQPDHAFRHAALFAPHALFLTFVRTVLTKCGFSSSLRCSSGHESMPFSLHCATSSDGEHVFWQDTHQQQKLQVANQELIAKNLSLQIQNEELAERLEREVRMRLCPARVC